MTTQESWKPGGSVRRRVLAGAAVIAAVILCAYWPALRCGFVWDDDSFLTGNPLIKASDGLHRLWSTSQGVDYWPLTSSTLWIEWRWWGLNPMGYHATNLALHFLDTLLLWTVLRRLRVPGAFVAALVFAVHPVNVESVAWITQRKNLLAMLFFLLSTWFFLGIEEVAQASRLHSRRWQAGTPALLLLSLLCFILAMLSKTSAAMLPVVLLGCIAWRRRLKGGDFLRLAPFFAVSAALTEIAIAFQHRAMEGVARNANWVERGLGAGAAVWFYLFKALAPFHLAFIYPQWSIQTRDPLWWVPLAAGAALSAVLWHYRRGWSRLALFGWGYFCVSLAPVVGLADVYFMRYSLVANHYEHLAIIGVIAPVAAAWEAWRRRAAARGRIGPPMACLTVVLLCLGVLTWRQCESFANAETLYRATLRESPAAWMAHNNLGILLGQTGRNAEAMRHFEAAVRLKPDWAEARFNLGVGLQQAGRSGEAMEQYREALRLQPNFRNARLALAGLLAAAGRVPESMVQDKLAFAWADTPVTHCELGDALEEEGRTAEAAREFREALRLDPNWTAARDRLKHLDGGPSR